MLLKLHLKSLLLIALCALAGAGASAQQVSEYGFAQSSGTYVPVSGSGTTVARVYNPATTYDTEGWTVSLPFTFQFKGTGYTSIYVNSNGGATFGSTTSTSSALISGTGSYDGALSVMNRDLWAVMVTDATKTSGSATLTGITTFAGLDVGDTITGTGIPSNTTVVSFSPGAGTITLSAAATSAGTVAVRWSAGYVVSETIGSAPNRTFVIEWKNFSDFNSSSHSTAFDFQIRLEETSNVIRYVYGPYASTNTTSRANQVGLRGASNADYKNRSAALTPGFSGTTAGTSNAATVSRDNASYPASGLTFTWTPPTCIAPTNLVSTNVGITTATLGFSSTGGTQWQLEVGPSSTLGNASNARIFISSNPYNASNLAPNTAHSWWVRRVCATGDTSAWSASATFTTFPLCSAPTAVTTTGVTATSVTLGWTAPSIAPSNGYQYEVRTTGAAGSGSAGLAATGSTAAGVTTATINTLTPITAYTVYVRGNCGGTTFSNWTSGVSFTTACAPVSTFPYTDTFQSSGLPACWSAGANGAATYYWEGVSSDGTRGVSAPFASSGFLRLNVYNASASFNPYTLTSRPYTLSSPAKQVQYYYYLGNAGYKGTTGVGGSDPHPLMLLVSANSGTSWDTLYRHSSANSTFGTGSSTSFWTPNAVSLSAYAGQTVLFRFVSQSNFGSGFCNQALDEFTVMDLPACLAPSLVSSNSVTYNAATIGWTAPAPAPSSGYQYEVRSSGNAGSGATGLTASGSTANGVTSASVTGLAASTTYSIYVRGNCGTSFSAWTTAATFTTACSPFAASFSESFNGGALPSCWTTTNTTNNSNANSFWKFSGTPDYGALPNGRTAGTYAWVDASSPYVAGVTLTSPYINLTGLASPYLQFDWFKNNGDIAGAAKVNNNLKVEGNNGSGWVTLFNDTSNAAFWRTSGVTLPAAFVNTTAQFRFVVDKNLSGNYYDDLLLDSVKIINTPSCFPPSAVAADATAFNTASLSWTAPATAPSSGYQYEVRTSGAAGSGSTGLAASGSTAAGVTTATVTGLTASTTYSVYVRGNCGASGFSTWSLTATTFATPCAPITTFPFNETFESNSATKACWKVINANNDGDQWNLSSNQVTAHGGSLEATLYTDFNGGSNDDWMILPAITLGANKQLRYWYRAQSSGEPNDFTIKISTTGSNPANFTTTLLPLTSVNNTTWQENTISLAAYTGTVYIAFHVPPGGLDGYYLHFDDVVVESIPTCYPPTGVGASASSPTAASLSWVAPTTGTPVSYKWEVRSSGAAGSGSTGLAASGFTSALSTNVTGLTANTSYSVYVRSNCGGSDTSAWSGTAVTFTTPCIPSTIPFTEDFSTVLPACWSQAKGALTATPAALTNASTGWGSDQYLNNSANGTAARINVFSSSKRDWMISPTIDLGTATGDYVLEFNLGIIAYSTSTSVANPAGTTLGSDDTVAVVVSTNNGATWSSANALRVWTAGNTPLNATGNQRLYIPMNGYSGQIKIGFYASEGTVDDLPDNDVFIDSVRMSPCTRPVLALGNDTTLCDGASLTLNAGTAATYQWSTGATTATISINAPGTYTVRTTNGNPGCFATDTIVVTGAVLPAVSLGPDTAICAGASLTLSAGNTGSSYQWNTGATTQSIAASTAGTYSVRVTNAAGCIGRDTLVLSVNALPVVNLGADTGICTGASFALNAGNAGSTYLWNTGATTQTLTVATAGTYSVRVTNASGCIGRDTIVVTVNPLPVVSLGSDTTLCVGSTLTLSAGNAGSTYLWNTGATTQTLAVTTAGSYSVRVTNASGCVGRDTLVVTAAPLPVVALGADTALCAGASIVLNAGNAGSTYLWNTGATTQTLTTGTAGSYSVRVTSAAGCIGRDTLVVTVNPLPVVSLGNDTAFCAGNSLVLNAGNAGSTYLWSTGATTQSVTAAASGSYSVRVTSAAGCVGRDTLVVAVNPLPVVALGADTVFCAPTSITLNAGNAGSAYLWNTGATTQGLPVSATGTYSVLVTTTAGCTGRDTIAVTVRPQPVAGTITVGGASPTFTFGSTGTQTGQFKVWSFGDGTYDSTQSPSHTYTANGTYTVKLYALDTCGADSTAVTVTVSGLSIGQVPAAEADVRLYPNPASSTAVLEVGGSQRLYSITVLNAVGAVVIEKQAPATRETLDLSGLASGSYLVRVRLEGGTIVRKLQVVK